MSASGNRSYQTYPCKSFNFSAVEGVTRNYGPLYQSTSFYLNSILEKLLLDFQPLSLALSLYPSNLYTNISEQIFCLFSSRVSLELWPTLQAYLFLFIISIPAILSLIAISAKKIVNIINGKNTMYKRKVHKSPSNLSLYYSCPLCFPVTSV